MDMTAIGTKAKELGKKYKYVLLVLAVGIGLMLIPGRNKDAPAPQPESPASAFTDARSSLEKILSRIEGVGKVELLLTYSVGETTIYQVDEDRSDGCVRLETVVISDGNRAESGLVSQILPPEYLGAVVVCQGGSDPAVKLAIAEAVANATGLRMDQISVLKMK